MARRKNSKKKNSTYFIISVIIAAVLAVVSYFNTDSGWDDATNAVSINSSAQAAGDFGVHYIDVGQADCELIKCGGDVVLIDGGDVDSYDAIKSYLDSQSVTEIDYYILTHAHADHIGSADDVINNYAVNNVIMTKLTEENTPTTEVYKNLLTALSNSSAKVIAAVPGNEYFLDSFSFKILAPNDDYSELNNTSVVIKATYGRNTFLFQGDAESDSEEDILSAGFDVSADVLKLGHHGSSTSSSADYLDAVNPKIAIVSCGKDNKYNHPSQETILKLENRGITYYRTDVGGNIVVTSDGSNLSVYVQNEAQG